MLNIPPPGFAFPENPGLFRLSSEFTAEFVAASIDGLSIRAGMATIAPLTASQRFSPQGTAGLTKDGVGPKEGAFCAITGWANAKKTATAAIIRAVISPPLAIGA